MFVAEIVDVFVGQFGLEIEAERFEHLELTFLENLLVMHFSLSRQLCSGKLGRVAPLLKVEESLDSLLNCNRLVTDLRSQENTGGCEEQGSLDLEDGAQLREAVEVEHGRGRQDLVPVHALHELHDEGVQLLELRPLLGLAET